MSWFNTHFSLQWDGGKSQRHKKRKLGSGNKDGLMVKQSHSCKQSKQGIHLSVPMGRQVFSHCQESRAPSSVMVTQEDKCHLFECPLLPSSSPRFMVNMMAHGKDYPLGEWVSCPSCVHFQSLWTPNQLTGGVV